MTLLTICQDASVELGIPFPTAIVAGTTADARVLLRMAKKEITQLRLRAFWQALRKEVTFTTLAATDQGAASFPADYEAMIPETAFNRTRRQGLYGPINPQEWAQIQAGLTVSIDPSFFIRGNRIQMTPTPTAGNTVGYEYISKNCVLAGAVPQATWTADTNTCVWDEEIITQGIIWRWRKHKGMSFEDERLDYEQMVVTAIMRDGGKIRINLNDQQRGPRGRAQIRDYNTIT